MGWLLPSGGRATMIEDADSLQISIPVKRGWFFLVFLRVWVGGQFFFLVTPVLVLVHFAIPQGATVPIVFVCGLIVMSLAMGTGGLCVFCWNQDGQEIIRVSADTIRIRHEVYRIGRSLEFDCAFVRYLRVYQLVTRP